MFTEGENICQDILLEELNYQLIHMTAELPNS